MEKVYIQSAKHGYDVIIKDGIRHNVLDFLPKPYSGYYIITDDHVKELYADDVLTSLPEDTTFLWSVTPGESAKTLQVYEDILTDMLRHELDRNTCVIALGGGVVGDLAGFVAATYMRGLDFIQMPTTLLAHDSSVGGKVAVNHALGKNLIGAFYPPAAVLYDTECLQTLTNVQWRSGFAEMIKHSLIDSVEFYQELKASIPDRTYLKADKIRPFLAKAIKVKSRIVTEDERETGIRMHLNFGHTLGHAIEKRAGWPHGEAVATGMLFALFLSIKKGASELPLTEITTWFHQLALPLRPDEKISVQQYLETMGYDKKRKDKGYQFVLLEKIGLPYIERFTHEELYAYLDEFLRISVDIKT